jgi:serine/threonine protein kinase
MNETYYDAEIAQKYTMLEVLGQGGFGTVFKAKQLDLRRTVAIKYLSIERSMNERERTHFQNEARILSSLKHPNVVEIYAYS